jgi:hypothetical protein
MVLTRFLGTDAVSFAARSDSLPGVFRNFTSLAACADEVGMSRIYGGIHFAFDNEEGKRSGARIGEFVMRNFLLPDDALPLLVVEPEPSSAPRLRLHGHVGAQIVVEASPDLVTWAATSTNTAVAGGVTVPLNVNGEARFFRVLER